MKIREIVLIVSGTLAVLVFTGFMFDYYLRAEEVQVVKKDMYFDSLILQEQIHLKKKDSALEQYIKHQDEKYKRTLQYHDTQIKKIHDQLKKLNQAE
jgi:arylsulfatase A-like enzyme